MNFAIDAKRDVTLVVLSGGKGLRLGGRFKPLLLRSDGVRISAALERTYGGMVRDRLWVAPSPVARGLRPFVQEKFCTDPGRGPLDALLASLDHVQTPWIFLVAADHPNPSKRLLKRFAAAAAAEAAEGIAVGDVGKPQEPFFALYRTSALRRIRGSISGCSAPLRMLFDRLQVITVDRRTLSTEELATFSDADDGPDVARLGLHFDEAAEALAQRMSLHD